MKASVFFKTAITDNNINGIGVNVIAPDEDFFADTAYSRDKPTLRKNAIFKFVKQLHQNCADRNLSELGIKLIRFDDEFEANTDQPIFTKSGENFNDLRIHTGNIAGSLALDGHIFNINSRFGNAFLQYMVASTSGFLELENFGGFSNEIGIGEWLLVYFWKLQLKSAFALGLYKTYKKKEDALSTIKGQININKWVQKSYFDGRTHCSYNEHSYSNEINTAIDMALKKVFKSKYQGIVLDLFEIKRGYDSLHLNPIKLSLLKEQKVLNPYFHKYNQVYDLSLRILKEEFSIAGEKNSFSAFLFDISLLFEHHIRKLLKAQFKLNIKNKVEYTVPNGIGKNDLKPDVIVEYASNNSGRRDIAIYDVKYKHFNSSNGVDRLDRFQLISYVSAYMNDYNVVECGFIFPCGEEEYEQKVKMINQHQLLHISGQAIPFNVKLYKVCDSMVEQAISDSTFVNSFYSYI